MMEILQHPLVMPVVLGLAAGLLCFIMPRKLGGVAAVVSLVATAALAFLAWRVFDAGAQEFQPHAWLSLRVDALSRFVLLAIGGFGFFISLYSIGYMKGHARLTEYYAYLLWTMAASMAAVVAGEWILLLCCWGFLGLTLYLMTGIAGPDAAGTAKKAFIIIGGSDCVLIFGIALLWQLTGSTRMDTAPLNFDGGLTYVAFLALITAAFAKAGAMPVHTWVPDLGQKAPAPVAAFLPASLDKLLGIYLLARITTGTFAMNGGMNTLLMALGAATIIFAVMMALVQHDMKRLLSYHAVSQVGYMVLGIGTGTAIGIAGGLFHMINNALYKCCLFLCAGSVEKKAGTTDLDQLGGLATTMKWTFAAFVVAALSISGIPPLNGFASKWMVYQGVIESGADGSSLWIIWLGAAMLGSALTLASFVKIMHAAFLRKPAPEIDRKKPTEVGVTMWLPGAAMAMACVLFGVLAYRLPLRHLVLPAVSGWTSYLGTWWAGPATAMLVVAFAVGFALYLLGTVRKARSVPTWIGGEDLGATHLSGVQSGPMRDVEVTGVDFYRTIQELPVIGDLYRLAEKKWFDIYDVGGKILFYGVEAIRKAHNGVLLRYLTWAMFGLLIVMGVLIFAGHR